MPPIYLLRAPRLIKGLILLVGPRSLRGLKNVDDPFFSSTRSKYILVVKPPNTKILSKLKKNMIRIFDFA